MAGDLYVHEESLPRSIRRLGATSRENTYRCSRMHRGSAHHGPRSWSTEKNGPVCTESPREKSLCDEAGMLPPLHPRNSGQECYPGPNGHAPARIAGS